MDERHLLICQIRKFAWTSIKVLDGSVIKTFIRNYTGTICMYMVKLIHIDYKVKLTLSDTADAQNMEKSTKI